VTTAVPASTGGRPAGSAAPERRRVLMTTTAYPPSTGGVQSHVADLCARLESFVPDVATLWLEQRTDWLLGTTTRLHRAPARPRPAGVQTLGWTAGTRLRMLPWVAGYYALVPLAARRLAALMEPYVDALVRPEHVVIHNHRIGREFLAHASLLAARRHGLPFVLTTHHHPKWHGYRYQGWTEVYRAADALLTHTAAEQRELERLGVAPERIHVIGGAADDPLPGDESRFRRRLGGSREPVVLFVGQLYQYKGVAELTAAADALHARGIRFQLVFLGPHTRFSRDFFARRSRPWLHVLGHVSQQDKWDALTAATVVCLPSRHEAFGRVFLEAWSKRRPVIGCRIPAVREVVTDGASGILVEPGSAAELAGALERVLDDPELARRLGESGYRELGSRFTWRHVVYRVEAAYEAVAAPARAGGGR